MKRLFKDKRGTAAVEFALCSVLIFPVMAGVGDIGMAYSQWQKLNSVVESGTLYSQTCSTVTDVYGQQTCPSRIYSNENVAAAADAMTQATNLDPDGITVTYQHDDEVCACPNEAGTAIMTGGYGDPRNGGCVGVCPNGTIPGYYMPMTASMPYHSVIPWSLVGDGTLLKATSLVRVQ